MILGKYLITSLVLDLKFSGNVIIGGDGPYEGFSAPIFALINYKFKSLTIKLVKL